ncbi:hypothetical protein MSUIS_00850 [Mycoplasma suis KI3806]|uniref:Uncharacterized protein n=1 Tax=Mycoplasma suis (strain KI_3806) TaxID=708248 RepID=F0V2V6_MYCS3|nr:hypothetical protein [Mycoplasma suis]CBZ40178.1 hypothetical protein MSUIS_00850 [Mycoplasma suis KI3806]
MFGSATLAKISIVLLSLGGAFGGKYLISKFQDSLETRVTKNKDTYSRPSENKKFGNNGQADERIFGEYVLSNGENNNVCFNIEKGVGSQIEDSKCKEKVSNNLKDEQNKKDLRIWLRVVDVKDVGIVLKGLGASNKKDEWFKSSSTEVTFNSEILTCKLDEKNPYNPKEVVISCYFDKERELSEASWNVLQQII